MKKYEYINVEYSAKGLVFSYIEKHRGIIDSYADRPSEEKIRCNTVEIGHFLKSVN